MSDARSPDYPGAAGFSGTTYNNYIAIGQALATLPNDMGLSYYDYLESKTPPGWTETLASGGTSAFVNGFDGGRVNKITGATAGGLVQHAMASAGAGGIINNISTSKWYFATRQSLPNAATANTRCGQGLFNGSSTVMAGCYGGLSTTNFVIQYNGLRTGSALTLGVVDTSMHIFEVWHNGDGLIRGRQDLGTISTGTLPSQTIHAGFGEAYNNGAAEDHRLIVDWFVYLTART